MERFYRQSTRVFAVLTAALGIALVVTTIAGGGGPLALGIVVGVAFLLIGAGRFFLAAQR